MIENKSTYLKSGMWYMVGNILIKGVSFIALPVFTRLLTPDDFGRYNIFMSYESILAIVIGLGIAGTVKIAYFDFKDNFNDYISSVLSLTIIFSLLFDVLTVLGYYLFFRPFLDIMWSVNLLQFLVFSSLGTALYNIISVKYVICAEYKSNLTISAIYTVTNVVLSVVLCYTLFADNRYLARIVGYASPIIIISIGLAIVYIKRSGTIVNRHYWKYALKLGAPLILHSLSMMLLVQMGKIMINFIYGDRETGLYSIGVTVAGILSIILSSFDNAWAPWFYRRLNEKNYLELTKGNNKISIVFAIICSCFILLSPEMLQILTTKEYYEGIYSLIPLVVASFINFMYLFAVNQEYYYKRTETIAIGTIVATGVGFLLNYMLMPVHGYIVAAYVAGISNFILFVLHTSVVKRMAKPGVVNYYLLFFLLLGVVSVGVFTIFYKDFNYLRYLIVLIMSFFPIKYLFVYLKK